MPETPGPTWRLFVALEVSAEVKARLVEVQSELRAQWPRLRASWTRPDNLHLTLRFLGEVPAGSVTPLTQALVDAAGQGSPLELAATGLGCFPDDRRPRVLWAGVTERSEALSALQARIVRATQAYTREPAEPAFHGHLTLARIKEVHRTERDALAEWVGRHGARAFGHWTAARLELMRSELDPGGSRYSVLAQPPLGRPPT